MTRVWAKLNTMAITVLMVVSLAALVVMAGCSGGSSSASSAAPSSATEAEPTVSETATAADYVGAWDITNLTIDGKSYDESQLNKLRDSGLDFFLNIEEDGTTLLCLGNETNVANGTWSEVKENTLMIEFKKGDPGLLNINGETAAAGSTQFKKAGSSKTPPAAQAQGSKASAPEPASEEPAADAGGVSPDVKEALDSYEAVMDEYVAFMQKYKDSGYSASMLGDYTSMLQKYTEFSQKIDAMDTDNMSTADYQYYIEVTSRVSQKLLDVAM